jgi:hypothetical protein
MFSASEYYAVSRTDDGKRIYGYVVSLNKQGMKAFRGHEYECFLKIHSPDIYEKYFDFNFQNNCYCYKKHTLRSGKGEHKITYPAKVEYRYSAEYRMSEGEFNALLTMTSSEWHGHKILNPTNVALAEHKLREKLVGVYTDVLNRNVYGWERDLEVLPPEPCTCTLI